MKAKYLNKDKEALYILHFPGNGISSNLNILEDNLNREIKMSDKLSIISIMDKKCFDISYVAKQCEKNNIKIYNTALDISKWNNTLKISHILNCLQEIDTEYVLILDGRDTCIVNDLNDDFIKKYLSFDVPIVFNGTPFAYPKCTIETLQELLTMNGIHKFLNAGVCVGTRTALIEFYTKAAVINKNHAYNNSEQYIIRLCKMENSDCVKVDSECKLFRIIHQTDTDIKIVDECTYQII